MDNSLFNILKKKDSTIILIKSASISGFGLKLILKQVNINDELAVDLTLSASIQRTYPEEPIYRNIKSYILETETS